jgi:large subunit ribosomal protein L33
MAKTNRESASLFSSLGTGVFYTNRKNKKKLKGEKRMALKKYDPVARKHVLFEEKKASKLKKKWSATSAAAAAAAAPVAEAAK